MDENLPLDAVMHARFRAQPCRIAMPDVCCDLVWVREKIFVLGPMSRARPSGYVNLDVEILNLHPFSAREWLGMPMNHLTDREVLLADIARELADRLSELFFRGRAHELVRAVPAVPTTTFPPRTRHASARTDRLARAAHAIEQGESLTHAADLVNLSERQLERLFADHVGLTPREYKRILRFRRAVRAVKAGCRLAEAAALAGFADQSHFTRDVQKLTGRPPREVLPNVGVVQDSPFRTREY
ncbi:MAG TPA: helix-turn-helix domain-containing protein [Steroidobacteraceae bacterium]|nr:helix-turn-helix domain-containing protein [Steroidobacteraceae bacterium]